ncbi:nuclease domain-containing protein [Spirosoma montaniterrae]|uniref:DUF2357 domain-containing protein n=1 Tax=Spirosoma montaniterrae TaxID=1178516 RepID=A0A1P9WZY3_9BACT|nr:nuclease domain-containing protein [Spirosoma montaniterrae]AQG80939.1 hypothetical protein AWR27_17385 [Spirosoma montaniterrae]
MLWTLIQRVEGGFIKSHNLPTLEPIIVSETDSLCLWAVADGAATNLDTTVWLSDTPFPVETGVSGVAQVALWLSAEGAQSQERQTVAGRSLLFCKPLLNRFGLCRISLQEPEQATPALLATLEVGSAKFTPDELTDLLQYLLNRGVTYWRSESSLTTVAVGETTGRGPLRGLARVSHDLIELERLWPAFRDQPQTRLEPLNVWEPARATNWTERTLRHQVQHPETLRPATPADPGAFRWQRRWLAATHTLTSRLLDTTDTLENRTLHGYLHHLLDWLRQQRLSLNHTPTAPPTSLTTVNASVLRQWQQQQYAQRVEREIQRLIGQASGLLHRYEESLPVREPLIGLPPGMAGFMASDHYFRAGQLLLRWYDQVGDAVADTTDGLAGVRTLDRLYELLCLFKLQDALVEMGYRLDRYEPRRATNPDLADDEYTGSYTFTHTTGSIARLHYEFVPESYLNVSRVRNLLPDFVLEYLPVDGEAKGLILDAKYRRWSTIVRTEYAELTLKYLHGLVPRAGLSTRSAQRTGRPAGPIRTEALLILHPTDEQTPASYSGYGFYQKERYDAFSNQVSRPLIGTVEVAASSRPPEELVKVLRTLLETSVFS